MIQGETGTISVTFTGEAKVVALSQESVVLTVLTPAGRMDMPEIEEAATGVYQATYTFAEAGPHRIRAEGERASGTVVGQASEGVTPSVLAS